MSEAAKSLAGSWALITGSGRRIGATIARYLHGAGANIAVHYFKSSEPADALVDELNGARSESAIAIGADLRRTDEIARLVEQVIARAGRLDVLVNNASSFYPTELGTITEADWDDLVGSNLKAPLFLCQAALPHLRASRGTIVNMIDIHAQRPLRHYNLYGAAKAGLAMLTRSLARDLAPEIRVNGIAPGAILWPDDGMTDKVKQGIVRQIPLARTGVPDDIAMTVLFLVRDAPYITGQIISVDGGRSIGW